MDAVEFFVARTSLYHDFRGVNEIILGFNVFDEKIRNNKNIIG